MIKVNSSKISNDKPKKGRFLMNDISSWPFWLEAYNDGYVIEDADYVRDFYPHEGTIEENWELGLKKAKEIWPDMRPDTKR